MNKFRILLGANFLLLLAVGVFYLAPQFKNRLRNQICTQEAKLCPDGSSVSRTGPNCEFPPCDVGLTPIPYPISNIYEDWLTHIDLQGRFYFKYPPQWYLVKGINNEESITLSNFDVENTYTKNPVEKIRLDINIEKSNQTLEEFIKGFINYESKYLEEKIITDGITGIKVKYRGLGNSILISYRINTDIFSLSIDDNEDSEKFLNQILATFNFIDQKPALGRVNWNTFTNSTYKYSISAPEDFSLQLCKECNPPEINFGLYNSERTIEVGAEYAHQWSLTANMSSTPIPVKNLEVIIQGKKYQPEEYFDQTYKRYIFKIDNIENNGQFSQISLSGGYSSLNEANLVSNIISTFKFLDQSQETENSDWKKYTDSTYKFSIKYPPDWELKENESIEGLTYNYTKISKREGDLMVRIAIVPLTTPDEFLENTSLKEDRTYRYFRFNNLNATEVEVPAMMSEKIIFIDKGNKTFILFRDYSTDEEDLEILTPIISSFDFL